MGVYSLYGASFPALRSVQQRTVAAGVRFGLGRALAYGHDALFNDAYPPSSSYRRFGSNVLLWAAATAPTRPARVAFDNAQFSAPMSAIMAQVRGQHLHVQAMPHLIFVILIDYHLTVILIHQLICGRADAFL